MTRHRTTIAIAILTITVLASCRSNSRPAVDHARQIAAADALTRKYAASALGEWKVRGKAAGDDCDVLIVATSIIMEDAMVDALHYGAGAYDIYEGGVQNFSTSSAFRGVAYRDASGKVWAYDGITHEEANRLSPCGE